MKLALCDLHMALLLTRQAGWEQASKRSCQDLALAQGKQLISGYSCVPQSQPLPAAPNLLNWAFSQGMLALPLPSQKKSPSLCSHVSNVTIKMQPEDSNKNPGTPWCFCVLIKVNVCNLVKTALLPPSFFMNLMAYSSWAQCLMLTNLHCSN